MEQAPDFARFVEADAVFHRRVAEVGGNRLLVVILTALRDPIVRLITAGLSGETDAQARAKILRAHGEILEAIRTGDIAAADRRSRRHLIDLYAAAGRGRRVGRASSRYSADRRAHRLPWPTPCATPPQFSNMSCEKCPKKP